MSDASVLEPRAITRDLFSASIGSVCCCYVGQPFDTVKARTYLVPRIEINGSSFSST